MLIYLDHNATTPLDSRVLDEMMPYFQNNYANPSSRHLFGFEAAQAIDKSREQVAELIGASPREITFTSGATESINLAIQGAAHFYRDKGKHIITSATEHSAVLDTCRHLESEGYEVTYLPVGAEGTMNLDALKKALRPGTILVCLMHVNNETGVINPVREIADLVHSAGAFLFSDTTQSVGKVPINVDDLGADMLCFSAHKIYGPKGAGGLYTRLHGKERVKIAPLVFGGGHERGLRSGTLNVPGIVGLGKASELANVEMRANSSKIQSLRDVLEENLLQIQGARLNGNTKDRIFNVTNIYIPVKRATDLVLNLSSPATGLPSIAVSNGSACNSNSNQPSHVLKAMGLNDREAWSSLRFSMGKTTTAEEIELAGQALREALYADL